MIDVLAISNFQISWILVVVLAVFVLCTLYYSLDLGTGSKHDDGYTESPVYTKAALASTSEFCDKFVLDVFQNGGSVADAAVVALVLQGLTSPQSLGVGGGFLLTYYDRTRKETHVLNAREYSPSNTHKDMFKQQRAPSTGGLSSAIPGEIMGYWELHQKFGKLPWKTLFEPAIKLCREGIPVTKITAQMLINMRTYIMASPTLKDMLTDPKTEDVYKYGDVMKRPILADTLEIIANEGVEVFYNGRLTTKFVEDIQNLNGIITVEDMNNYRAKWTSSISMNLTKTQKIYTAPNPGSGQIFLAILDVMFSLKKSNSPSVNWFRIVECWKHAFGQRCAVDGPKLYQDIKPEKYDPLMAQLLAKIIEKDTMTSCDVRHYTHDFEKNYHEGGTCHICLLAPNGDAVSVTSSVNYAFGAHYVSESTGILMNNHMMDFAIPEYSGKFYTSNQLAPDKQPVSCMVPSIIIDTKTDNVKMVVGAAGGFKILTAASQLIIETLLFDIPPEIAIVHRRLHHQLIPMVLFYEEDFPQNILEELRKFGHHIEKIRPGTSAAVITIQNDGIRTNGDMRRMGSASGF